MGSQRVRHDQAMHTYTYIQKAGWQAVWMTLACDPGGGAQVVALTSSQGSEKRPENERQTHKRRRQYGFLEGKMIPDILKT